MTWQIVYVSTSLSLDISDIAQEVLSVSRRNNALSGITGVLLFSDGAFFQVLEGPKEDVEKTYEKIAKDSRHLASTVLIRRDIPAPMFPIWDMGWGEIGPDHPIYNHLQSVLSDETASKDLIVAETLRSYCQLNDLPAEPVSA